MSTGTAVQHHWEESLNLLAKSGFSRTVGAGFMQICFPCSLHKFHISSTFSVVKYEYECSLAYCTHNIIKEYSHVCLLNTLCLFVGHFKIKSRSSSHLTPHNKLILSDHLLMPHISLPSYWEYFTLMITFISAHEPVRA